ncbi:hypothetical protein Celaphus_00005756 [Cervus elaphus hippelaphus]|uniref:F-box domain-containing protein n=1 Tax=Cervus elaphus hippelaphus TaxID=46360 RepID=A0A212CWV8_CEREH|nr:hypothetical protein Celaphus_00005756 [Cervus elaphus hippelaphus]
MEATVASVELGGVQEGLRSQEPGGSPASPHERAGLTSRAAAGLLQWVGGQPGQGTGVRDCSGPREVVQIDQFLKETAAREASAKLRLQQFIEELLERADRAERQLQGGSGRGRRAERGSPSRSNEVISPEILKMRAALFCIFTYLDTRTLLHAAEVCRDWRFVARHPAVWTRVLLENARVCSKFLAMLAQWCTQAHSLTLQNLKPRQRGKKESKEEYARSTRGCLEAGLESLLKAAGGNLLILRISHCPNILTDRSLWLASCYCRALQAVTYRSATDPVGHEVIWALGAGCREIVSLQVAPLHPCQQPMRFSNRCLQMIGRCWPHLRALGVGGAGCGVQGLASLARNCMRLQVLELDHVSEITQEVAAEVCREGLKGLEMLVLTATPVTPKALLHFNKHHAGPAMPSTYAVSRHGSSPSTGASSRIPAASQSSGCYDSDSLELPRPEEGAPEDSGPGGLGTRVQAANGGSERAQPPRSSGLRRQAIQNWQRRPRRHSTEGEEGDVSDVGSRTTESEAEGPSDVPRPGPAMAGPVSSCRLSARPEGGSGRGRRAERGSPSRSNEVISPEILKMRAALFCIFTYLDTRTLLHAAEVCRDWRFVARHPAVWTRVLLENARVCSKFLAMLAQWCTQAHSLTLQNLKPRQRGKKESKEEYARSTRGCLEAGLESLLKAAGGNLLILRISHCPNILTDRSLWLASCYCRICRNLKSIVVQIGIADYFKEPSSPEAQKLFEDMVTKLQALRRRPGFSKILHIKVEGC